MMLEKPLESVNYHDLEQLIDNKIMEGKFYDYKQEMVGKSDHDRKEFLSDISSFANTSGGHLIYGMQEDKGLPTELTGQVIDNLDEEINRLDQIILAGMQPRMIPAHQIRGITVGETSKMAIVVRIHKSLTLPHMVTFKNTNKFYARNSHGKYLLDVGEIRNLITMSESAIEKIRSFRDDRLSNIITNDNRILADFPKVVLHLMPLSMSDNTKLLDLGSLQNIKSLMPMRALSFSERFNFDGLLLSDKSPSEIKPYTYCQLFKNGCIEAAETFTFRDKYGKVEIIPSIRYEYELVHALNRYLYFLKQNKLEPPIYAMVSLMGVKGYKMYYDAAFEDVRQDGIDRDNLILPEIVIDSFDIDHSKYMKPIFDSIWNSCGLVGSMNYESNGDWKLSDKEF